MIELKMEHVLILVIVVFMLYHFMNRCGNGFSVGGDCRTWDSEFTCLASNSAFWDEDCEWMVGTCLTETEADHMRVVVAASRVERKAAMGLPPSATHDELKAAEAQAELLAKNALRAAENPDGIVECPRVLASKKVDSSTDINTECNDTDISDICRNSQDCNKCYEQYRNKTYACEYLGGCKKGAECFVYSYDNMCKAGLGVTIQPGDDCIS